MGILFTPLQTLALLTIPREKMAQASAITNTIRQIAGSIGVALFTTLLTSRINFHAQIFGSAIQSGTQEFKNVMYNMAGYIHTHAGGTMATAMKQGQGILMSHISTQAFIQGIDDDFLLAAIITVAGFIPTIILRTKKKTEQLHNA